MVSIPACHAGDRGSIPRRGGFAFFPVKGYAYNKKKSHVEYVAYLCVAVCIDVCLQAYMYNGYIMGGWIDPCM